MAAVRAGANSSKEGNQSGIRIPQAVRPLRGRRLAQPRHGVGALLSRLLDGVGPRSVEARQSDLRHSRPAAELAEPATPARPSTDAASDSFVEPVPCRL